MLRLGITGGIGSGKSVVSRLLGLLGVPVYISDTETKRLMASDAQIRRGLVGLLGEAVYDGGQLNKPLLASYLFGNEQQAARVNAIVPGFFITKQNHDLMIKPDGSFTPRAQAVIAHTPAGRFGNPDELFGTIHYLICEASSFVTGALSVVDGGYDAFSI